MSRESKRKSQKRAAPQLSRQRILDTALRLADLEGVGALSMRRLAVELSVQAMSLYNHVANKEEILDGIVDMVVSEIALPRPGREWKTEMRRRAFSARAVLLRHRWATMELMSRVNIGEAMLRYVDATLGCLLKAGFGPELADHAWNAIDSFIYGFTLQELSFPFPADEYRDAAEKYMDRIPAERFPHLYRLGRLVLTGSYDGVHRFELGLDLILDGLGALLRTEHKAPPPAGGRAEDAESKLNRSLRRGRSGSARSRK